MALDAHTPQKTILEIIKTKQRTLSAEIIPPRNGTETDAVLRQIDALKTVPVDFISVTKGAGGSLRGGTLPIAQMIKQRFDICSLAHFTCRDYTAEEVENALMDHFYFGVSNILALRGDPPDGQPLGEFKPEPGRHAYAWQLVEQIGRLNAGDYLVRDGFDGTVNTRKGQKTNFCIGVAAHPEHEPFENAVEYLAKKVEMGAQYAITQMLFKPEPYARFVDACAKRGLNIPIIPGLRIITQASSAHRMTKKFGAHIPAEFVKKLELAPDQGKAIGLEFSQALCGKFLSYGAPGIHVFIMNDELTAVELLKGFRV